MKEDIRNFPAGEPLALHICMAGISFCDGSYHIQRTASEVTVIEYVLSGAGYVTQNGADRPVSADHIYLLHRGQRHNYYADAENPWQKIFLNIEGPLPQLLMSEYGLDGEWLFDGTGLRPLFERVAEIVYGSDSDVVCQAALAGIFLEILVRLSLSQERRAHNRDAIALRDFLDANIGRIVSNAELAAQIYRSPDFCIKLFGREFGVTPYEYQLNEKMNAACRLLRNTAMPVSAVAAAVGYTDAQYFSGLFRRKRGLSPREYRKKEKQQPQS